MKANKVMGTVALMLSLTLVSFCFVGGTFEKYVFEATGPDTAEAAKWAFEVNDIDITAETMLTFDLFETVNGTANIPILFSADGENWKTTLDDVLTADNVRLNASGETTTITVRWQWPYEQKNVPPDTYGADDASDIADTGTATVTAKVTAIKLD